MPLIQAGKLWSTVWIANKMGQQSDQQVQQDDLHVPMPQDL